MLTDGQILDAIAEMDASRIVGLVRAMERRFGVSSSAPVVAYPNAPAVVRASEPPALMDVVLEGVSDRIAAIRAIRREMGVGTKAARAMVDNIPCTLAGIRRPDAAERFISAMADVGATCSANPSAADMRTTKGSRGSIAAVDTSAEDR